MAGASMIGRTEELERLRECMSGPSLRDAVVLIEGEAGSGKTRMLQELRPSATGYALEHARASHAPIRDLLVDLDRRYPRVLQSDAALTSALTPIVELRVPESAASDAGAQRRLLDAVSSAIAAYTSCEPLVLAIEDMHWIDAASCDLLMHLARTMPSASLLMATYRPAEAAANDESRRLLAQLSRSARARVVLQPLRADDAMLLISQVADAPLPLATRRKICELAQGNPLLLIELTRHACEHPRGAGASLPVSLQELVHERLRSFDERDRDVLRVCAALGNFDVDTVCAIAGIAPDDLLEQLHRARSAGLIAEEGTRFVFRHALIRQAISEEILGVQVADLHALIARHVESQADEPRKTSRLAYHYWMAREIKKAEQYNREAAESAYAVDAFDDAALFFERAIGGREVSASTYDLYYRLATAYERGGRYRHAADLYRKLIAYGRANREPAEVTQLSVSLARCCFHALDDDAGVAAVREELALCDPHRDPATAFELRSLLGWYLVHLRRIDEAHEELAQAEAFIEHGEHVPLIRYYEARAAYQVHAHGGGTWRAEVQRALELADALELEERVRRYTNVMALSIASDIDDFDFALHLRERVRAFIEASGERVAKSVLLHQSTACWIEFVCGRLADARATIELLLPYLQDTAAYAYWTVSVGIPLALRMGDERLLHACTRRNLLDEAFASKDPVVFGPVATAVAERFMAQGRAGEAMTLVENTLARLPSAGNNFELLLLSARIGSEASAKRAEALLEPWTQRSRSARGAIDLIRAYRSKGAARTERALSAAAIFETLPWPLHQAQALALAGQIDAACAIYRRVGASAEVVRLESLPRSSGALRALSKREIEVAELVAQGYSNKAIAEALVLSERTVENHIASIFGKWNVRSRAEIASVVARENTRAV